MLLPSKFGVPLYKYEYNIQILYSNFYGNLLWPFETVMVVAVKVFSLSKADELRREEICADVRGNAGETVVMRHCHGHRGNQQWTHDRVGIFMYLLLKSYTRYIREKNEINAHLTG